MRLLSWPIPIHINIKLPGFLRKLINRPIQPMVVNSIRLRQIVDRDEQQTNALLTVLEFDEERTNLDDPHYVDLIQLRSSLDETGIFFIWTCSCGVPGCAGRFEGVQVSHGDGMTTWHDLDTKRKYLMRSDDLRNAFDQAILEGRLLLSNSVDLEVIPEHNSNAFRNDG